MSVARQQNVVNQRFIILLAIMWYMVAREICSRFMKYKVIMKCQILKFGSDRIKLQDVIKLLVCASKGKVLIRKSADGIMQHKKKFPLTNCKEFDLKNDLAFI